MTVNQEYAPWQYSIFSPLSPRDGGLVKLASCPLIPRVSTVAEGNSKSSMSVKDDPINLQQAVRDLDCR